MAADHQLEQLRTIVSGRRFVVATEMLVPGGVFATSLRELGASGVLLIGGNRGSGDIDPDIERDAIDLQLRAGPGVMASIRAFADVIDDPPAEVVAATDAFDPDGSAWVLTSVTGQVSEVLGRPVFGARDPGWRALEDKTVIDRLWDEAGVVRAPSRIVAADPDALGAAHLAFDAGLGTAWVADNRSGWHGGGEYLRWVRDGVDQRHAVGVMRRVADRVRVMPFLDGLPCSIHGWVIGGEVAAFAPVEMIVLRVPGRPQLRYVGAASTWRAAPKDREAMRDVARRVGVHLRDRVGYRGVFTVDGVMTADGFRPTELNPRWGIGLGLQGRATGLPMYLLHGATIEHPELDWRPRELEGRIVAAGAANPVATARTTVDEPVTRTRSRPIAFVGDAIEVVDEASASGQLVLGPAIGGGFLRVVFDTFPAGPPFAPAAAQAFALGAAEFGLDLPAMEAAPALR